MKTKTDILKKLAELGVLETTSVKEKKPEDIIITDRKGIEKKVVVDNLSDGDIALLVNTEILSKFKKSIEKIKKICLISALIVVGIWILIFFAVTFFSFIPG